MPCPEVRTEIDVISVRVPRIVSGQSSSGRHHDGLRSRTPTGREDAEDLTRCPSSAVPVDAACRGDVSQARRQGCRAAAILEDHVAPPLSTRPLVRSFEAAKPKSAGFTAAPRDQSREKDGTLDPLLEAAQQVATVLQPESPQPERRLRRRSLCRAAAQSNQDRQHLR